MQVQPAGLFNRVIGILGTICSGTQSGPAVGYYNSFFDRIFSTMPRRALPPIARGIFKAESILLKRGALRPVERQQANEEGLRLEIQKTFYGKLIPRLPRKLRNQGLRFNWEITTDAIELLQTVLGAAQKSDRDGQILITPDLRVFIGDKEITSALLGEIQALVSMHNFRNILIGEKRQSPEAYYKWMIEVLHFVPDLIPLFRASKSGDSLALTYLELSQRSGSWLSS